MNYPRLAMAAVAGTLAFFVLGFLGEGWLFRSHFLPYQAVYRPSDQLQRFMPIGMVAILVANAVLAAIYVKWSDGAADVGSGLRFGLLIGGFVVCVHALTNLVTMNLGTQLGLEIAAGTLVQWLAVGLLYGVIYRPR